MFRKFIGPLTILFSLTINAQNFTTSGISFGDVNSGLNISSVLSGTLITQSSDLATITAQNSVACTTDNDSYFRRFDLDVDHGINSNFNVSGVDFATETSTGIGGVQDIIVNLYSINNASLLELANLTLIGTATISVADGVATVQNALITGTLNGLTDDLVVEIVANDTLNGTTYFIGSNANGQSAPSFVLSAVCGAVEPTDTSIIGSPNMHIIMAVHGSIIPTTIPSLSLLGLLLLFAGLLFVTLRMRLSN